jgi:RNA polymerase sigma factor (sigma-70 family)
VTSVPGLALIISGFVRDHRAYAIAIGCNLVSREELVAGRPRVEGADDPQLAASLRGAGGKALTQVYESYGARLYDYCHTYLRDQTDAAVAVHDSLIAAQQHIAKLREPQQLRGWLYAIARRECLRRLDDRQVRAEGREAPLADDDSVLDADERARRAEIRELLFSALATLTDRQREVTALIARHDLDTWQLGRVLGVSADQAVQLAEQASDALELAFTAALIARAGWGDCPSVNALVGGWPPTQDAYKRLARHIVACPMCGEQHLRKTPATRLLPLLPAVRLPAGLWEEIYATTSSPERRGRRSAVARRAEPFDASGWPAHEVHGGQRAPRVRLLRWPVVGVVACGLLAVGAAIAAMQVTSNSGNRALAAPGKADHLSAPPTSRGSAGTRQPTASRPSTTPTPTPHTASPTPTPTTPPLQPTPRPPTPRPPTPKGAGTLVAVGCHMQSGTRTCTITVFAHGGPVNWSVTGSSDSLRASDGGELADGQSVEVTVRRKGPCFGQGSGSVSFAPGGVASVTWTC